MNILVVRLSAIGDCTLVLPVIRSILEQNSAAKVTWLICRAAYQLLKDSTHPRLTYIPVDKPKSLKDYRNIKLLLDESYDVLLAMQASTRANLIYPWVKAKRKIGFDKVRARELQWLFTNERIDFEHEHLHDSFRKFAKKLGVDSQPINWNYPDDYFNWRITVDKDITSFGLPEKYIVVNPAASKLERSWFADRYAQVIEYCYKQYGLPAVLTGGNAEFERQLASEVERKVQRVGGVPIVSLVAKTSLQQLAAVLEHAQFCIAPDTGPAHIANAMNTPVIGLYAVASSRLSGPYLFKDSTIDKFDQAVKTILKKDPREVPWRTRIHDRAAMALINVDDVKSTVDSLVATLDLSH